MAKAIIYQVFTRLFGNRCATRCPNGTLGDNGSGKFDDFSDDVLARISQLGVTHVWYTGVIRHATQTDYSSYGIPRQHPEVVKGKAGSPYAICDYYDVDPDLATNVADRMREWEALIQRTHKAGMKVIMDFVPNHVAREYHSICKPQGVKDLGEDDDTHAHFSPLNNFYYCWGNPLDLSAIVDGSADYQEVPAKATGNNQFNCRPGKNDWYETVKLNYGIDYCGGSGVHEHFNPTPDTWLKMVDVMLFWAGKGVDGFRCDMAEMVPAAFWAYATNRVKSRFPHFAFIGEVYNPVLYRQYLTSGFDYLYDKVGMYDCLRDITCGYRRASDITNQWQRTNDILDHMLYFLENHDEQRVASDFFAGNPWKAIPALMVSCLFQRNPLMIYFGQELGERGMDEEGFSGKDGRTTIFDYWSLDKVARAYYDTGELSSEERNLRNAYQKIMCLARRERAISEGQVFDLMYVNQHIADKQFAFLRKYGMEVLLIVVNFADEAVECDINIPQHAFEFLKLSEGMVYTTDLLTYHPHQTPIHPGKPVTVQVPANGGRVYKWRTKDMEDEYLLNDHNKQEYAPAHTAEHLLNQLMTRLFGCERSNNAHIERKKSKISYVLDHKPSRQEEKQIEMEMNRLIEEDLPVKFEFVDRDHVPENVKLDRLPDDASETIRLVRIGDYDVCPCIGKHVRSTSQIGHFQMLGTNWDEMTHTFRIRFKIVP